MALTTDSAVYIILGRAQSTLYFCVRKTLMNSNHQAKEAKNHRR